MKRAPCFDVPAWHEVLWAEEREAFLDEDFPAREQFKGERIGDSRVAGFSDSFVPELFHRLYAETPAELPPEERAPAAAMRSRVHELVSELPEFEHLRAQTKRSIEAAAAATKIITDAVAAMLPAPEAGRDYKYRIYDADKGARVLAGLLELEKIGGATKADIDQLEESLSTAEKALATQAGALDASALRSKLREAIAAAEEGIEVGAAGTAAFGVDATSDPTTARQLAKVLATSPKLRAIAKLAGRMRSVARQKRATKSEYARSELVGIEQVGSFDRLLPAELGALGDSLRGADLVRRVFERSALGYKLEGKEAQDQGPIIMLIDNSGSMAEDGSKKEIWAKAIMLAVAEIARKEKRAFAVCFFNAYPTGKHIRPDSAQLIDMCADASGGGTCFGPAVRWGLDVVAREAFKKGDIVLVTDGEPSDSPEGLRDQAKAAGVKILGIGIGMSYASALPAWTDEHTVIDDLAKDDAATSLLFEGL